MVLSHGQNINDIIQEHNCKQTLSLCLKCHDKNMFNDLLVIDMYTLTKPKIFRINNIPHFLFWQPSMSLDESRHPERLSFIEHSI